MEIVIWLITMIPVSLTFTILGIYACRRKKPMWFWSGSTVHEREISDIPAYNRANGIMWLAYSSVFWISTVLGLFQMAAGAIVMTVGCLGGIPVLIFTYNRIYEKYKNRL